jgi:hypothetical protein
MMPALKACGMLLHIPDEGRWDGGEPSCARGPLRTAQPVAPQLKQLGLTGRAFGS